MATTYIELKEPRLANLEDIYPLSPMQQGMLFHSIYSPDAGVYFEQSLFKITGDLDVSAFERAWQRVVERHSILRTSFLWEGLEKPVQVVHRQIDLEIAKYDWRDHSEKEREHQLESFIAADRGRDFLLSSPPLMRLALFRFTEDEHKFLFSRHHLLLDRWSRAVLLKDFFAVYDALSAGREPGLDVPRPYSDYIAWLGQQDSSAAEEFWRSSLAGFTEPTGFAVDRKTDRPIGARKEYANQRLQLSEVATEKLQAFARQHRLTLNTLVQGAWALLLSRYSANDDDVVFGVTVAGRSAALSGVESMVGLFINTLPLRVGVPSNATVLSWLESLQEQQSTLQQYEYSSLIDIQGWSDMPRNKRLFESILVFENLPVRSLFQTVGGLEMMSERGIGSLTDYPITVLVNSGSRLTIQLVYDCERFEYATIRRILLHLQTLLENLPRHFEGPISRWPMLTEAEREQILSDWNDTQVDFKQESVLQLFAAQVERTPDAAAVVFESQQLSYRELSARANQLAHYLRELGVGADARVGIAIDRSVEMAVAVLGALKAGAAYVPLDPAYPNERLSFMLKDAQCALLLTNERVSASLPDTGVSVLCLDRDWGRLVRESGENLETCVSGKNLAYVIYTSGSTGWPKGVAMTHGALGNLISWQIANSFAPARTLQFASLSFDVSFQELFSTWCSGGTLMLVSDELRHDDLAMLRFLAANQVERIFVPSVYLQHLAEACTDATADNGQLPVHLREIITAGEQLKITPQISHLCDRLKDCTLHNHYGPSETHVVIAHTLSGAADDWPRLPPIGRPIANTQIYVLDQSGEPAPIGVAGELCIGGANVSRGYLDRPELTADKFLPNHFSSEPGARIYCTGDLARYASNGTIEFLGRIDSQVKIRGYRIELSEIETVISRHAGVRETVVLAREDEPGDKRLVAYVVPGLKDSVIDADANEGSQAKKLAQTLIPELRSLLAKKLPQHMMPSAFVLLEALPLTANGKLNRRALPAPGQSRPELESDYIAPRTLTEELLAEIWSEVLKLKQIGVNDDFFQLGGHSLLATQVISRVRQTLNLDVPLRALFEAPTVSGLAEKIRTISDEDEKRDVAPIIPVSRDRELPLSYAQQRLWFLAQLEPDNPSYNLFQALRFKGTLDIQALEQAINAIVARHESLRTIFKEIDGQPLQIIAEVHEIKLGFIDLEELPEAQREADVRGLALKEAQRPFDLARDCPLRAGLVRIDDEQHVLLLTMHHIASDGWSIGILFGELAALYKSFCSGQVSPLAELPIQYADYAVWQREWLQGEVLEQQLAYWREQLAGAPALLELPTDRPRAAVATYDGGHQWVRLPQELSAQLKAVAQGEGATLYMVLLAAFQVLLSRYSGQEDIVVGSLIANRTRAEIEGLIGFFVNTLVLRTDLSGNPSFRGLLRRVKEVTLDAYAHQDLPFEKLVEELQLERSLSHTPLFQVLFILQNAPQQALELSGLTLSNMGIERKTSEYDLTLSINEGTEGLSCWVEYSTDLFDAGTIERMVAHFRTLLESIVNNPEQRIAEMPILSEPERQQLLVGWNNTRTEYPRDRCIHELFETQVERTPGSVAVTFGAEQLTYAELNERANKLAHYLRGLGMGPEVLVGICIERSLEMVVGLLGILKAGGAYVPLDPAYPKQRLAFMLDDAQAHVLLTQQQLLDTLPEHSARRVCIDADWEQIELESAEKLSTSVQPENPAYVIYTSGSTGKPRGVMIQHRSLVNWTTRATIEYGFKPDDRILQFSSISFDTAAEEIYPCLTLGATLVLRSELMSGSIETFLEKCRELKVTVLDLPTAFWHELTWTLATNNLKLPTAVRLVIFGGEKALPEHLSMWHQTVPDNVRLMQGYGPTEVTVVATIADLSKYRTAVNTLTEVPIGRAIGNAQTYILDKYQQPVPIGISGELYIGGEGLARGYLNSASLTAERFIPNHFSRERGARLYRTGDVVRCLSDGEIEFLGRRDDQVKIRGYRVELGEIEALLRDYPEVREAVVVARGEPDKRLVGYLVADQSNGFSLRELQGSLSDKLPDYMIPSSFVLLDELPLTPNGKVDRHALPLPEGARPELEETYVAPRSPIEETLVVIWSQLLRVEQVGIDDNFFDLGGHSLLATRLISQVRKLFQIELPLRSLFESPTVAALAERVEATLRDEAEPQRPPLSKAARDGHLPLSFAQQRLWFLDQLQPDSRFYNMQFAFRLKGPLNTDALQRSLNEIVRRHEALRTSFAVSEGQPMQVIAPPLTLKLSVEDLRGLPESEREGEVQRLAAEQGERPFDLTQAPLLRVGLWQLGDDEHVLLLTMHHIASDGWSIGILFRELAALYRSFCSGQVSPLAELPIQYADYAVWQREWLQGEVLEQQLAYWREQLAGVPALLELPTDRQRPAMQTSDGAHQRVRLPLELSTQLKAVAQGEGATLYMVLLAAFQVLLSRYSGQEDIVVGSPIANRTRAEIEGLIGFFVNTLVLRTDLSGNPTFRELMGRVREVALDAYAHQDVPFEKLVEELNPERSLSHTPLFQVLLAVQNMPESSPTLAGLELQNFSLDRKTSEFDLSLYIGESSNGLSVTLEYNTDLFAESTTARMLRHFEVLLQGIVAAPDQRISELPLLPDSERQQLLVEWNDTQAEFPRKKCAHVLFEEQVERTPNATAVVFDGQQLTYAELNARTNRLAHYLRKRGVGPDTIVGLFCERSLEMVVGVLGILKAGAAYLPLDASYPSDRLSFMLQDAAVKVLLTQEPLRERLSGHGPEMICLDREWEAIGLESDENSENNTSTENLAYVIYTSGSTGQPKGVAMTQRSLTNLISWQLERAADFPPAKTLQFASLSFDVSFQEMFSTWCNGGTLVLVSEELRRDAPALLRFLKERAIERVFLPFVYLQHLAETFEQTRPGLMALREIICAGEQLELTPQIVRFCGALKGVLLYNHYGPSESHVVTAHRLLGLPEQWPALAPIGRPISNTQIYIVDRNFQPVPIGVPGELCIGGASLARGYLNRSNLTAAKFLPDPFSEQPGARIYVTGDLARYREDGTIEFLGRADYQVKIRGFRVEPGEIETMLAAHPSVREAVVVACGEKKRERTLVGYVVAAPGNQQGLAGELRSYLKERLPDYMIPSSFVLLDELPLTPNGKVDRNALPTPNPLQSELSGRFVAPQTDTEIMLAQIWERLLDVHPVGVKDNFFDLGGHSLLATRLVSDIKKVSGKTIPLTSLFQKATIEYLAGILDNDSGSSSWSTLVEIQSGTKWPFFCVNAPNVGALGYFGLARHMDPNQSVYGLQGQRQRKIEGEHDQFDLENLARDYIGAMRGVQPEGPYLLGGMCLGAHIAFEMARQLEAEGQRVSLLAIFDTWNLDHSSRLRAFLRFSRSEQLMALQRKIRIAARRIKRFLYYALSQSSRAADPAAKNGHGRDLVPRIYRGNVTVFRVYEQQYYRIRDEQLGWGWRARGDVAVHFITGEHLTIFREPHVHALAKNLSACIQKAIDSN